MINENRLFNEANTYFLEKNFDKALFIYSQLSSNFPMNREYPIYALFCDIASEDIEKAQSLFDYFSIAKEEDIESALKYVEDMINAYDGDIDKMMEVLSELSASTVDSLDAIRYEDFKKLIKSRGSFRIAFEDIMFSTKVAIETKEDFFDFVDKLIENDFNNTAYSYLDGFNEYFSYDTKIEELYKKLEEKKLQLIINNKTYTDNSKEANKDSIFVISKQNKKFVEDAKKNGCIDFIEAKNLKTHLDMSSIKVIGITGTNGKTTTAAAIYSILLDLGIKAALQGTRGFFINDERIEEYTLTTPMQLGNFAHIKKAIDNDCQFFVMEVSSHAIEQNRIEGLEFELKIHTNITRDHLDYHKTIEEYINVKNSFFADETKKLLNKDDPLVRFNSKNAYTYGMENPSTYNVSAYSFKNGMDIMFSKIESMHSFNSPVMGLFNIYNLLAAVACVDITTDKNLDEICDAVENFAGVSGRMETISSKPFVIVDFAHTPDGMKEVFESFNHRDIIAVFGAGGDRDKDKRPLMGQIASNFAKTIIVTSDNPRFEDPDLIIEDICKGIKNKDNLIIEINRKEAIKKAIKLGRENEDSVVLILGKGDEPYQTIYDKKFPLLDKEEVLKYI